MGSQQTSHSALAGAAAVFPIARYVAQVQRFRQAAIVRRILALAGCFGPTKEKEKQTNLIWKSWAFKRRRVDPLVASGRGETNDRQRKITKRTITIETESRLDAAGHVKSSEADVSARYRSSSRTKVKITHLPRLLVFISFHCGGEMQQKRRRKRKGCRWRDAHQISKPALISNLKLLLLSSSSWHPQKKQRKESSANWCRSPCATNISIFNWIQKTAGPKESQKLTQSLGHVIDESNSCLFSFLFHFLRPRWLVIDAPIFRIKPLASFFPQFFYTENERM
jgi:hypothetical protein